MSGLALAGMPGAGKTTVGRLVAERTGLTFLDLDQEIERRVGRPPAEVLRLSGEAAFRALERRTLEALQGLDRAVLALGGGTLLDPANLARLAAGPIVCLTAPPAVLADRLGPDAAATRPLLAAGGDLATRLQALLDLRRPTYDGLAWHVETASRSAPEVAAEVLALLEAVGALQATALPVATPSGGYAVLVGRGLLAAAGALLRARALDGPCVLITDRNVGALHGPTLAASLARAGARPALATIEPGEVHKTLETVASLYRAFLAADLDRSGFVAALGGGVPGDISGFAAATWLRGVGLVHLPTSLLAMVDASIGGKTAVNLPEGKNLVGAFHQPSLVITDPDTLATLPEAESRRGLAEALKTALVGDPALLAILEARGAPRPDEPERRSDLVLACARVKARLVSLDPFDRSQRQQLNLGHTFAHGLETASGHALPHGDAVAVGLLAACRLSARLGLAEPALATRIEALLNRLGLPTRAAVDPDTAWRAMAHDKKRRRRRLRLVLPLEPGRVAVLDDVPSRLARQALVEATQATG